MDFLCNQIKDKLSRIKIGVAGKIKILEIKGCHNSGLQPRFRNKLQGSIYLETITSNIWRLLGDSSYQKRPILVNLGPNPFNNK